MNPDSSTFSFGRESGIIPKGSFKKESVLEKRVVGFWKPRLDNKFRQLNPIRGGGEDFLGKRYSDKILEFWPCSQLLTAFASNLKIYLCNLG